MKAYWWPGPPRNFGDQLMRFVAQHVAGVDVEWAKPDAADVILGGSILGEVTTARPGTPVWGAGLIMDGPAWPGLDLDFRAVRGPLTASRVNGNPVVGDPGVLAPVVWPVMECGGLGPLTVRHYTDPRPGESAACDPRQLAALIASATEVTSSSLHGLIVAHAYGVPARWDPHHMVIGDGYKFNDYALSVGLDGAGLLDFTCPDVSHLQDALMGAWPW